MNEINITDKDDAAAIRYPSIKNEEYPSERQVTLVTRDINIPGLQETLYFPLDFCLEDIVIDSVAKKYSTGIEFYSGLGDDEEHFLLGTAQCQKGRKFLNCPYMKKVNEKIDAAKNFDTSDLFAIYLLGLDNSNDNRQKFLAMTKKKIYISHNTQAIENYSYKNVRFTPDGIELKSFGESVSQNLLDYYFDERFLNFVHEFMLLRCATLVDARERHPFANVFDEKFNPDMVADMKINVAEVEPLPAIEKRNSYLKFLVDTAAAEGYLEARTIMRLCYLAREFGVSADSVRSWLKLAANKGIPKNKLQTELTKILSFIGVKYKFVFIKDVLEAGTDSQGVFHRADLLKILKRPQFGVEKFVENYLEFIKKSRAAEYELQNAFQNVNPQEICFKNLVRAQSYSNRLNLQLVSMGAMLNEQ